jgi:Xaa-Pro dipeptidase
MAETAIRLAESMKQIGADALILLSPQAYTYVTGFRVPSHPIMRWRHAAAVVGADGLRGLLTVDMEETTVAQALPSLPNQVWREFKDDPMEALARLIGDVIATGPLTLGIETDFIPTAAMQRLTALLPRVTWVACDELVETCRASKTPSELSRVRDLVLAVDGALESALSTSKAGDAEFEIGQRIIASVYATGITEHRILIVASGERSWLPNVGPSDRTIRPGDVVRVEIFGIRDGYQAGVARTAVVGAPSAQLVADWSVISGARQAALSMLRPGASPKEIYATYKEALGPLADRAIAFFGHGMGLDLHERPYISATSTDLIEPGAIIGIEPFAMIPGRYGLQVKDVVAVTDDGFEMISNRLDGGSLLTIAA